MLKYFFLFFLLAPLVLFSQNIRYKADNVKIQQKQKKVILTGNAFIQKGKDQGLKADRIIWDQKTKVAEAFKNISFLNRSQGVVYRGDYLKFFIDKDEVLARENPSIEKKANNLVMYANEFFGDTRKNVIEGTGDARVNIDKKEQGKRIIMQGEKTFYDLDKNIFQLNQKVKISQERTRPQEEQNSKVNIEDYDIFCEEATFLDESETLECFKNAKAINRKDQSTLSGERIIFNSLKDEMEVKKNVRYFSKDQEKTSEAFSDNLIVIDEQKKLTMIGNVRLLEKNKNVVTSSLECSYLEYFFAEDNENLACRTKVRGFDQDKNVKSNSDYLYYNVLSKKGFLEDKPFLVGENEDNNNFIYADKIDFDDELKKVYYRDNVTIKRVNVEKDQIENTTTCTSGLFDYESENKEVFTCKNDVTINNPNDNITFYGDELITYFENDYSILQGDVRFIQNRSATNYVKGTSEYLENFYEKKYALLNNNVEIIEYNNNNEKINSLNAKKGKYDYSGEYNIMEGYEEVQVKNIEDNTILYADYFFYNEDLDYSYVLGEPLLIDKNSSNEEDNFIYADRIELYNNQKVAKMKTNVVMFSSAEFKNNLPDRKFDAEKLSLTEYIACTESDYNYANEGAETFECFRDFQYFDLPNKMEVSSDYMRYDINEEHAFIEEDPLIFRDQNTNQFFTYADTMEMFFDKKEFLFNTNVLMVRKTTPFTSTNGSISCVNAKYSYTAEETLECFNDVVVIDNENDSKTTSGYLKFYITNEYALMSENPEFFWNQEGEITYVKGDVFERFEQEKIMYVKGNVFIDNGVNEGESSLGLYDVENDLFILYSNPKIKDKRGSEFFSEEVTFDLKEKKLILDSDVFGTLQLE